MSKGIPFRDTFAAKGSDLYKALVEEKDLKKAVQIYNATTERMKALTKPKDEFEDVPF